MSVIAPIVGAVRMRAGDAARMSYDPTVGIVTWLKVGGVWKEADVWIKVGGVWKAATMNLNVGSVWKP